VFPFLHFVFTLKISHKIGFVSSKYSTIQLTSRQCGTCLIVLLFGIHSIITVDWLSGLRSRHVPFDVQKNG